MKVVFMGTPDFAVGTLEEIVKAGHEVAAVVTQPDKPKGRGKTLMPTPVKEAALKYAIPVYQPLKVRAEEFVKVLEKIAPDIIVVAAFGQIISKEILIKIMERLERYIQINKGFEKIYIQFDMN